MLELTDVIKNEILEPITFVLTYPTVLHNVTKHAAAKSGL